jgi:HSP20 family protein
MNLIKVNRMPSIFDTVDGIFDGLFNNYPHNLNIRIPNYDIASDNDKYIIEMEVPGIKKSEISIEAQDQIIKISAKRDSDNNSYSNASSREFEKEFNLPDDAVEKNISANLKNGILEIKIPRKTEVKSKAINIPIK